MVLFVVLEYLLGYEIKKPAHLFGTGFFYTTIAIFVSAVLFFHAPSMVIVTFMTLPTVYVFTNILRKKSLQEVKVKSLLDLVNVNIDVVEMYTFLFLGMVAGVAVWFSLLPADMADTLMSEQLFNLYSITQITAAATTPTAAQAMASDVFLMIAANNIKLVLLMAVLSFIFSAGALFILSWNASVVGVAIGMLVRRLSTSGEFIPAIMRGIPLGFAYYILHLIPEVIAYFIAAIAGALISSAMMRYDPFGAKSRKLIQVAMCLLLVSIGLILLAAGIEINLSREIQLAFT
ncbi:MAG: stage II sporulation protein M [Candidatus Aenigmatarchaeota archaeon]|nr:stage II sporulation protein M [Candidatus Aenigmarchaeota archaeon]